MITNEVTDLLTERATLHMAITISAMNSCVCSVNRAVDSHPSGRTISPQSSEISLPRTSSGGAQNIRGLRFAHGLLQMVSSWIGLGSRRLLVPAENKDVAVDLERVATKIECVAAEFGRAVELLIRIESILRLRLLDREPVVDGVCVSFIDRDPYAYLGGSHASEVVKNSAIRSCLIPTPYATTYAGPVEKLVEKPMPITVWGFLAMKTPHISNVSSASPGHDLRTKGLADMVKQGHILDLSKRCVAWPIPYGLSSTNPYGLALRSKAIWSSYKTPDPIAGLNQNSNKNYGLMAADNLEKECNDCKAIAHPKDIDCIGAASNVEMSNYVLGARIVDNAGEAIEAYILAAAADRLPLPSRDKAMGTAPSLRELVSLN